MEIKDSVPRRLRVGDFFDQVIAEVPDLPPGLGDRLRDIVRKGKQGASERASIQKAIEAATSDE